ncbi:MAG: DUF5668 domain-containing protein [Ardenticatenaceae bacterium]|nr:DUF5668 domain-containing protein [Ardenticatenaceae bacterium]
MGKEPETEIKALKEQEKELFEPQKSTVITPSNNQHPARQRPSRKRRQSPSLFGPVVLIALGVYFLLSNLNIIDGQLHWEAVWRVWPLFLVFAGINIIARQLPGAFGSLMSGLVGISAVAVFGAILLFADSIPFFENYTSASAVEVREHIISQPIGEADSGRITIDGSAFPIYIDGGAAEGRLIEGNIDYVGNIVEDYTVARGVAIYEMEMNNSRWPWSTSRENRWDIQLTDDLPLDLNLDLGSGSSENNLSGLQLTELWIDGGSGSSETRLANGSYEIEVDMGSGSSQFTLPSQGQLEMVIDGGSGSIRLYLPDSMEARIDVDSGSGSFSTPDRFKLVSGERNRDGIWQTEGYNDDDVNRIDIRLDVGSGSVSVTSE